MGKKEEPLAKPMTDDDVEDLVRYLEDKVRQMRSEEPEPDRNDKNDEQERKQ